MEVYEELAEFYDLVYSDQYDLEFYLREARNARGPVLEVACGTGRILLKLLQEGIDVTGVDLSKNMLGILGKKARSLGLKPDVHQADMCDFRLPRKFKLIILPYRSFMHLRSDEDRRKALLNFKDHLEPDGRLILHTYNPSKEDLGMSGGYHPFSSENLSMPDGTHYRLDWFLDYDRKQKVGHYRIVLRENGREHTFDMDLAYLQVKEVHALLESCGYGNIRLYCGFDYGHFEDDCKEALWIAEK
jgi:SAM-dependent methyltransferase